MADVDAWMPLWIGDYLADTGDLTTEEHGAYLLLLMAAWRAGGTLSADPDKLARLARVPEKRWSKVWATIARFFDISDQSITQGRLVLELQEAIKKKAMLSDRGRKGAAAKHSSSSAQGLLKHNPSTGQAVLGGKPSPSPSGDPDLPPSSQISVPDPERALSPPRPHRPPYPAFAAVTLPFLDVYNGYPNKNAKAKAAATFQEIASGYPGGELALRDAILAWFGTGVLKKHPYLGEDRFRPLLETVLAERRWEDEPSAPDDARPAGGRRPKDLPFA